MLVDLWTVGRIISKQNFIRFRAIDCPALPVLRPIPFLDWIPAVIGKQKRVPADGAPNATAQAIIGRLHATVYHLILRIVDERMAVIAARLVEIAVEANWSSVDSRV